MKEEEEVVLSKVDNCARDIAEYSDELVFRLSVFDFTKIIPSRPQNSLFFFYVCAHRTKVLAISEYLIRHPHHISFDPNIDEIHDSIEFFSEQSGSDEKVSLSSWKVMNRVCNLKCMRVHEIVKKLGDPPDSLECAFQYYTENYDKLQYSDFRYLVRHVPLSMAVSNATVWFLKLVADVNCFHLKNLRFSSQIFQSLLPEEKRLLVTNPLLLLNDSTSLMDLYDQTFCVAARVLLCPNCKCYVCSSE